MMTLVGNGHGCFYGLNGEAFTMAAGMPWTVVKPNGLSLGPAASQEILVAHDDLRGAQPRGDERAAVRCDSEEDRRGTHEGHFRGVRISDVPMGPTEVNHAEGEGSAVP